MTSSRKTGRKKRMERVIIIPLAQVKKYRRAIKFERGEWRKAGTVTVVTTNPVSYTHLTLPTILLV